MKKQQLLSCTVLVPVNLITPHLGTIFAHWQTQRYVNSLHTCLSWWNLSVESLTYIWVESRKTWRIWWRRRKEGRERQRKAGGWWRPVILILDDLPPDSSSHLGCWRTDCSALSCSRWTSQSQHVMRTAQQRNR